MESVNNNSLRQTQRKALCLISLNNIGLPGDGVPHCVSGLPFGRVQEAVSLTDFKKRETKKWVTTAVLIIS